LRAFDEGKDFMEIILSNPHKTSWSKQGLRGIGLR
jgi:hypothetical protein